MRAESLDFNVNQIRDSLKEQRNVYYKTNFNFILQHNGIRPNKMHLLIAPTGVGKSSLTHSIIDDLINQNENIKILLYLTEETKQDFKNAIVGFGYNSENFNKKLTVMVEDVNLDEEQIKDAIETEVLHNEYDLIIFDNLNTSKLYPDEVKKQSAAAIWLKTLTKESALYLIAHTSGNNYNTDMLDETNIRGSKTICNLAEFLYVLQPVRINNSLFQFIRIIKHRNQHPKDKFFKLLFCEKTKTIKGDRVSDFEHFKDLFKQRNKL